MKYLLLISCVLVGLSTHGQEQTRSKVFKVDGVNIFVKAEPEEKYEVIDEIKTSGALKGNKTQAKILGAAGYNKITYAIEQFEMKVQKAAKKGNSIKYDGVIVTKANSATIIRLKEFSPGTASGPQGAFANAQPEKKTGKLVFYASKPLAEYTVVSKITFSEGGFGETMRGVSKMDVAINGMLDKGKRWVKKGKIDSDFDALIVDWRALRNGRIQGELIKFN